MIEILIKFIVIFTISAVYVQREISSSKLTDDAKKMTEMYEKYLLSAPYISFHANYNSQCNIVNQCCPDLTDQMYSILSTHKLEEKCIGSPGSKLFQSHAKLCLFGINSWHKIKNNNEFAQFSKVHRGVPENDEQIQNWRARIDKVCLNAELSAQYCNRFNMDPLQSCQEKLLRSLASENGGKKMMMLIFVSG